MDEFQLYQSYSSAQVAQPLLTLLQQNGIPFDASTDTGGPNFDPTFAHNTAYSTFMVKLSGADFERVRQLEEGLNADALASISPDHYLFGFSDAELFDVLIKSDEWNSFDVAAAGQLLRQRGRDVTTDTVRLLREHRVAETVKPEPDVSTRIWWGYGLAVLGGLLAIFIGWDLYNHKKTLLDGRRVYTYAARDRAHGLRIVVVGVVALLFWIVVRLWVF